MAVSHKWAFKTRFRGGAYGWKGTSLASKRMREAVSEIKKVAKSDPALAGEGVVEFMCRLYPALQQIDGSSGSLGIAVNRTLEALIPVLIKADWDMNTRGKWLEKLFEAIQDDGVQFLSPMEERWGEICVYPGLAHLWADRIFPLLKQTWAEGSGGGSVVGSTLCVSCLLTTERYDELEDVLSLKAYVFWHYDRYWAEALARQGKINEAITYAESRRKDPYEEYEINSFCERVLLDAGRADEAYQRYGLASGATRTYLSQFREVVRKYHQHDPRQVLLDMIERSSDKGKWFAAAKDAGFLDIALDCAAAGST